MPYEHYSMVITWSDRDQAFLVAFPEWDGKVNNPAAHGATYEEAAQRGHEALADLVQLWQERGWELPAPQTYAIVEQ